MGNASLFDLLVESRKRLYHRGFNLWGATAIDDYDAVQCRGRRFRDRDESSRSVIVIGSGGRALWEHLEGKGQANGNRAHRGYHPIDEFSREVIDAEASRLEAAGLEACTVYPFDPRPVNFIKLAESAGLGVVSPVVPFLLHPDFGPWVSLRGALVLAEPVPPSAELVDFDSCTGCAAPCLTACPVSVYGPGGEAHLDRCAGHRHSGGCATGCDVRRVCPVGSEHRYGVEEETFRHSYSLATLRRWYGLGMWRFVPRRLRRR